MRIPIQILAGTAAAVRTATPPATCLVADSGMESIGLCRKNKGLIGFDPANVKVFTICRPAAANR